MLTFKQFISEELTQRQKDEVSTWPKRTAKATKATDHYFGVGNDDMYTQLVDTQDKSETHKAIERHLGQDISPEDYKSGQTKDSYGRQTKIGKLLQKSGAPEHLARNFENDTTRQAKGFTGLTVRTTRSPEGVAGQTSGNQSWEQQSCKNFTNGVNKRYLKPEVKHGTVVHYLLDHHGKEIARATAHPHTDSKGNTVYATNSHYGIQHQGFLDHVEQANKEMSCKNDEKKLTVYKINPNVYNDNNEEYTMHPDASEQNITDALKDQSIKHIAIRHPNLSPDHISEALKDEDPEHRIDAISHKNASEQNISDALNDPSDRVRAAALRNKKSTKAHLDKVIGDKYEGDRVRQVAYQHRLLSDQQITNALHNETAIIKGHVLHHKKVRPHHIAQALQDKNPYVRATAIQHENTTPQQVTQALSDESSYVRAYAARNEKATPQQISDALDEKNDKEIRKSAAFNKTATRDHIAKALNDKDFEVRSAAIFNNNADPENISHALKDSNPSVKIAALKHEKVGPEHIIQALKDQNKLVRFTAIRHNKVNSDHIMEALTDPYLDIRKHAIMHEDATEEHFKKGLTDRSAVIRNIAQKRLSKIKG